MTNWRKSPAVAIVAMALFGVVQIAIPINRLGDHELPQRYGWQMFSIPVPAPHFEVKTGEKWVDVDIVDHLARVRGDLDLVALLPPHLCAVTADAVTVRWKEGEYEC